MSQILIFFLERLSPWIFRGFVEFRYFSVPVLKNFLERLSPWIFRGFICFVPEFQFFINHYAEKYLGILFV